MIQRLTNRPLRDQAGLTIEEVGTELDCHSSKISRLELAKRGCAKRDFEALMRLYGVTDSKRAQLEKLMIKARQRIPPWWDVYADVISANYSEFLSYEAEAVHCWEYQPLLIPAQLQVEEYARAVTGVSFLALGPDQIDSLVEVRMQRQQRLQEEEPLMLEAVVTEAALRLQVGGTDTLRAQLRHLRSMSAMPHVSLRVIPFEAGEKAASTGAFTLLSAARDADADAAFTESADNTASFRDDAPTLRRLNRVFRNLARAALSEQDSLELVESIEKAI